METPHQELWGFIEGTHREVCEVPPQLYAAGGPVQHAHLLEQAVSDLLSCSVFLPPSPAPKPAWETLGGLGRVSQHQRQGWRKDLDGGFGFVLQTL